MKLSLTSALLLTAVMILGLSGCSGETDLYKTIPANVVAVARTDFGQLAEKSGFTKTGDTYTAPDYISESLGKKAAKISEFLNYSRCVDLDGALFVTATSDLSFLTFTITDFKEFCGALKENGVTIEENGGFNSASLGGRALLFNDNQGWLVGGMMPAKAAEEINKILKAAGEMPVKKLEGICNYLESGDEIFRAAFCSSVILNQVRDKAEVTDPWWIVMSANADDRRISFEASRMKADGESLPFEGLQPVNPAVLGYVSAEAPIVLLAGLTKDFDWDSTAKVIETLGGLQARGFMGVVLPYLRAIDGTALLALDMENMSEPENSQYTAMVHMPQAAVSEALSAIAKMLSSYGMPFKSDERHSIMVDVYGLHLYAGNIDGYLGVSSEPFSPNHDNGLAKDFVGKNGGLYVNIPSLRNFAPTAPGWGICLEVALETDGIKGSLRLNNSNAPILPTIISAAL